MLRFNGFDACTQRATADFIWSSGAIVSASVLYSEGQGLKSLLDLHATKMVATSGYLRLGGRARHAQTNTLVEII